MNAGNSREGGEDAGLAVLVTLLRFHGIGAGAEQIRHQVGRAAVGVSEMLRVARGFGLKARVCRSSCKRLDKTPLPGIAVLRDGGFLLLAKVGEGKGLVQTPLSPRPP